MKAQFRKLVGLLTEEQWTALGVIAAVSFIWIPYIIWGR